MSTDTLDLPASAEYVAQTPEAHPPADSTPEPIAEPVYITGTPRLAGQSIVRLNELHAPGLDAAAMVEALRDDRILDPGNETLLNDQVRVLDSLFHRLIVQSFGKTDASGEYNPQGVEPYRVALALQTQKLCRQTADAINTLRALRRVPFGRPYQFESENYDEQTDKEIY